MLTIVFLCFFSNKVCCHPCDSKWVSCDFVRAINLRDIVRSKTVLLRLCATQKKVCCNHFDSKWIWCKFVRSKYLRDPKQIWCDFPARGLRFLFRPTRPKNGRFRQSRSRINTFRPTRPNKLSIFDFVRPRKNISTRLDGGQNISTKLDQGKTPMLRICAIQISYNAILCDPNYLSCNFSLPKLAVLRLCAN